MGEGRGRDGWTRLWFLSHSSGPARTAPGKTSSPLPLRETEASLLIISACAESRAEPLVSCSLCLQGPRCLGAPSVRRVRVLSSPCPHAKPIPGV